jgi:glycosyltransferase involved in cell wall biosynthesis
LPLCSVCWRRADAVIAISYAVKDWLVQERHIPVAQMTVIHYGIEPLQFAQPHAKPRNTVSLGDHAVIGSIGRLEPGKGHACLIRAMPAILQQVPEASLLIAGHDPWGYGQTLRDLIGSLGLADRVQLAGFQSDIAAFLHKLNVFAFASNSEGFGQVIIEAMAGERPVVASRIPPLTEIVVDGATGLLVEPDNPQAFAQALTWLLLHPDKAREMGRRGQERVCSHFLAERMSAETLSLYMQLCGEHHGAGPLV